jgi:two-component system CheB/CheR fusion protein
MVVFAPQNVISDPPFTRLDILLCRNMLIYMESELQKKLLTLFSYSLNPGGIMVLGTAETIGYFHEGFSELVPKTKIFKRASSITSPELTDFPSSFYPRKTVSREIKIPDKVNESIQTIADQILLQRFTPASVLINNAGDIIYVTGRTGKFLEPAAGKANMNIHAMAREGLRQVLPGAIRNAQKNFNIVVVPNIKIHTDGGETFADITLQRLETPESVRGMIIVVFSDIHAAHEQPAKFLKQGKSNPAATQKGLEIELQRMHEELRTTREEMQTSQEELKSTNEELQSTNEELQSTNEELTTSKEEMQSLNEELQTMNAELQSKVNDFVRANDDMKNLLNSIEIATLFLDKEINIRRFTDQATRIFKLREVDAGRPFTDLVSELDYPEIEEHARNVIRTLVSQERSACTNDGRWFRVRIMPYRTLDDHIDGLVITFTDITESKKLEVELKKAMGNRK